ncbi:DHHA1 domain-containing protein, partial [Candidatus Omnitrophota bacterium]
LSAAQNIMDGRVEIDQDLISDFDTEIRPGLLDLKEKVEKAAKQKQKAEQADLFNELKVKMDDAAENPEDIGGMQLVSCVFPDAGMQVLRKAASYLEKRSPSSVVILAGSDGSKAYLVCAVPGETAKKGITAKELVNQAAKKINGSGGGKENFAQAGGDNPGGLKDAVSEVKRIMEEKG